MTRPSLSASCRRAWRMEKEPVQGRPASHGTVIHPAQGSRTSILTTHPLFLEPLAGFLIGSAADAQAAWEVRVVPGPIVRVEHWTGIPRELRRSPPPPG